MIQFGTISAASSRDQKVKEGVKKRLLMKIVVVDDNKRRGANGHTGERANARNVRMCIRYMNNQDATPTLTNTNTNA